MFAAAFGAFVQMVCCVFVATIQTAVAVMVYRAVADIVFIHHVDHLHDHFRVVGGVAVYFHIEDMAAACQCVVRGFYFCFMAGATFVIYRDMVGIRVIIAVGNTG